MGRRGINEADVRYGQQVDHLLFEPCPMGRNEISEDAVPIAVEDKFIVFGFGQSKSFCPSPYDAARLGELVESLGGLVPLFDLRDVEYYYNDVDDFIRCVGGNDSYAIVDGKYEHIRLGLPAGFKVIPASGAAVKMTLLKRRFFAEYFPDPELEYASIELKRQLTAIRKHEKNSKARQFERFRKFIASRHRSSLLISYVMAPNGDKVTFCPYHSHAIHEVETKRETVLVGRPGVIASNTRATFSTEIALLESLVNEPGTKERHIQAFLERHPNFLRGLNYQNIYPQLILERVGEGPLRPDFILEPLDDGFCDILDIKLPKQKLYVGGKDRGQLAAGLHEVAAQLREYAAYFEQAKHRKFVREKYGLKVYRPRLIAVVGRDMKEMTNEQVRRAMTAYDNLQFMTFDELIQHARNRLLI
jgi:Domain of unknown function (DUF4263)